MDSSVFHRKSEYDSSHYVYIFPFFRRSDREHHEFLMCPVSGCTSTFEASTDLDSHIAANQHQIPPSVPRTSNDIARLHLIETLRSTNIQSQQDTTRARVTHNTTSNAVFESTHYQHFSTPGWALRTRKHIITMSEKTKPLLMSCGQTPKKLGRRLPLNKYYNKHEPSETIIAAINSSSPANIRPSIRSNTAFAN